jgi:hypothetical protein
MRPHDTQEQLMYVKSVRKKVAEMHNKIINCYPEKRGGGSIPPSGLLPKIVPNWSNSWAGMISPAKLA